MFPSTTQEPYTHFLPPLLDNELLQGHQFSHVTALKVCDKNIILVSCAVIHKDYDMWPCKL